MVEPPYITFLKDSAVTDAGIGIGIVGEVLFGMRNNRLQTELRSRSNSKLSEATERAGKLEIEAAEARERTAAIEKLTAWRRITPEQHVQIVNALRDEAAKIDRLAIEYQNSDAEAFQYAREIAWLFERAGVTQFRVDQNSYLVPGIFGVRITSAPEIDVLSVVAAFAASGIELIIDQMDLTKHFPSNIPAPLLYIFVAPKPPPVFELPKSPEEESSI